MFSRYFTIRFSFKAQVYIDLAKPQLATEEVVVPAAPLNSSVLLCEDSASCTQPSFGTQAQKVDDGIRRKAKPKNTNKARREKKPVSTIDHCNLRRSARGREAEAEAHALADSVVSIFPKRTASVKSTPGSEPSTQTLFNDVPVAKCAKKPKPIFWSGYPVYHFFCTLPQH